MARVVLDERLIASLDQEQQEEVANTRYTMDDNEMPNALSFVLVLSAGGSAYSPIAGAAGLPNGWTHIGYYRIESDAPITARFNTVDGTSGTEMPISPVITPALLQAGVAPSPSVTASVQRGKMEGRPGVSADSPSTFLTSIWLKNAGITNATVKVTLAGE